MNDSFILLINCPDSKGIIANVSNFINLNNGNITYVDQHVDREKQLFFMRLECEFENQRFSLPTLKRQFNTEIANQFKMKWQIYLSETKPRMAIFVSKYSHCLYDILSRYNIGELHVDIPLIISNHENLKEVADTNNIDFHHIPISANSKDAAEDEQLKLLKNYNIDFIVLARYMQIVSPKVITHFSDKIINIHHSFLPAFVGAKPYHSAYKRGVKIIGATSHYVTEELDAGPIIEQDVTRVTHTHSIKDLISKGRDLEKIVLANAIKLHSLRKVMVSDNKTIVFT